jgi:hypothetical protein
MLAIIEFLLSFWGLFACQAKVLLVSVKLHLTDLSILLDFVKLLLKRSDFVGVRDPLLSEDQSGGDTASGGYIVHGFV